MLTATLNMSERLACKAVGLARSTYRRLPQAQTLADPDADMRAWLRTYATKHPCHGFRRAWAVLRYDERRQVNMKKVHRLWREEGLQVRVHSPRKRAGVSSTPQIEADAPNVVWAIDFQFDSTVDGKAVKIASAIDEHTRVSLLHVIERSITAERLVAELEGVFAAAGGSPRVLRMDNGHAHTRSGCADTASTTSTLKPRSTTVSTLSSRPPRHGIVSTSRSWRWPPHRGSPIRSTGWAVSGASPPSPVWR
jgi:putative transposase